MLIEAWDEDADGQLTKAAMRRKLEARGYSVSRYVYAPGTYFPPHTHGADKIDGVLAGRFRMEMEGESVILRTYFSRKRVCDSNALRARHCTHRFCVIAHHSFPTEIGSKGRRLPGGTQRHAA
ncbi:MAG: hypothetical protein D4R48_03495 [Nitrosomonadales bacterium]|nr:MAG: hypothetical protein D4R48_03495 [Nitrosomonadales bacterium]